MNSVMLPFSSGCCGDYSPVLGIQNPIEDNLLLEKQRCIKVFKQSMQAFSFANNKLKLKRHEFSKIKRYY